MKGDIMNTKDKVIEITANFCRENKIGYAAGNAIAFLVGYEKTGNRDDLSQAQKWLDFLRGAEAKPAHDPMAKAAQLAGLIPAKEYNGSKWEDQEPPERIVIVEDWVGPCGLNLEKGDIGYWQLEPNWHGYYFAGRRLQWETIQANRTKWRGLK